MKPVSSKTNCPPQDRVVDIGTGSARGRCCHWPTCCRRRHGFFAAGFRRCHRKAALRSCFGTGFARCHCRRRPSWSSAWSLAPLAAAAAAGRHAVAAGVGVHCWLSPLPSRRRRCAPTTALVPLAATAIIADRHGRQHVTGFTRGRRRPAHRPTCCRRCCRRRHGLSLLASRRQRCALATALAPLARCHHCRRST